MKTIMKLILTGIIGVVIWILSFLTNTIFIQLPGVVVGIVIISVALTNLFLKWPDGVKKKVMSWIVGLLITIISWWFSFGFFKDIYFGQLIVVYLGIMYAANGFWKSHIIQWILKKLNVVSLID